MSRIKLFLSWSAVVIIGLCLIAVLGTYISASFEAFRGPSKAYFWIFLIASLLYSRFAIWLIIFSLPLMPSFHLQLEYVTYPAVKYFFAYSGVDAVVGLFLGIQLKHWYEKRKFVPAFDLPPWPFGMLLIVLTFSTGLAISRNLWQSASIFLFSDLFKSIFNYKLIGNKSDYLPIVDLIVLSIGVLLVIIISQTIRSLNDKNSIVFKPIVISLLISACWGIIQALTAFGLDGNTTNIRPDFFGYGAIGFQPDVHAFAGLMILGAVGLIGFIRSTDSKLWRQLSIATSAMCWTAIVLSKSRASLGLAIFMLIVVALFSLRHSRKVFVSIFGLLIVGVLSISAYIGKSTWVAQLYKSYVNDPSSFFDEVNILSSWRFDLHTAAMRMWSHFPLMGMGQGNLYRVSAIYEFSGSALMARLGGENAHNYFLQILAETGVIGLISYAIFITFPFFTATLKRRLSVAYLAIFSLFLGNIYSHSFIIRENYYLLMIFIGLLYSNLSRIEVNFKYETIVLKYLGPLYFRAVGIVLSTILLLFLSNEIISAYDKLPYMYGRDCYRASPSVDTAWSSGRYAVYLPPKSHGVLLKLNMKLGDTESVISTVRFDLYDKYKNLITENFQIYYEDNKIILKIVMGEGKVVGDEGGIAVLSLLKCVSMNGTAKINNSRKIEINVSEVQIF